MSSTNRAQLLNACIIRVCNCTQTYIKQTSTSICVFMFVYVCTYRAVWQFIWLMAARFYLLYTTRMCCIYIYSTEIIFFLNALKIDTHTLCLYFSSAHIQNETYLNIQISPFFCRRDPTCNDIIEKIIKMMKIFSVYTHWHINNIIKYYLYVSRGLNLELEFGKFKILICAWYARSTKLKKVDMYSFFFIHFFIQKLCYRFESRIVFARN